MGQEFLLMGTLREHGSFKKLHLIGCGDPGTGKTGSLAALINELPRWGIERVVVQDWDDGLDILTSHVKPDKLDLVHYATLRDQMRPAAGGPIVRESLALGKGMNLMTNWKQGDENLGPALSWGPETLFVVDSLTGMGDAARNYAYDKLKVQDGWRNIGEGMEVQDRYVQMLIAMDCHVILFAHVRTIGGGGQQTIRDKDGEASKKVVDNEDLGNQYPSALGRQLPKQIARHFNGLLMWHLVGKNRKIRTVPLDEKFAIKFPFKVGDELSQETGLVQIFSAYLDR